MVLSPAEHQSEQTCSNFSQSGSLFTEILLSHAEHFPNRYKREPQTQPEFSYTLKSTT